MSDELETKHNKLDEFEREPVPESAQKGAKSFWGMYAGEHTAGTEFMIGPLFIAWGVNAFDILVGLLIGNFMAVLSWRYLTAKVATDVRETLYFKLEKICGRNLVSIYNLANGVAFCFLAGAMVTVSATAVGVPFDNVRMPTFSDTMPTGVAWTVVCLIIGGMMTLVAVRGYGVVARVSHIAAPWMFLIFLACGVVTLAKLGTVNIIEILQPVEGSEKKIGVWGVAFFAWFCNAAMHFGMSDMSVLRFAKKPSYGWASAAGMYLGHYIAWICAALLLAYWVRERGANPAEGVAPGPMVYDAVGVAGLICVVIAGWTTANPTIYRAGLAFQGIMPKMSRATGTIIAGSVCTIAGIFPAFAMNLIGFVGVYGTILAPIGAIIVVDHFLSKRVGILSNPAEKLGLQFNWTVLVAWVVPVGIALYLAQSNGYLPHFNVLPCWIACGLIYLLMSKVTSPSSAQ